MCDKSLNGRALPSRISSSCHSLALKWERFPGKYDMYAASIVLKLPPHQLNLESICEFRCACKIDGLPSTNVQNKLKEFKYILLTVLKIYTQGEGKNKPTKKPPQQHNL